MVVMVVMVNFLVSEKSKLLNLLNIRKTKTKEL